MQNKRFVLCVTGASGMAYAKTFIESSRKLNIELDCIFSENAKKVFAYELGLSFESFKTEMERTGIRFHEPNDLFSPLASGSVLTNYDGVIVLPCSTGTLGAIANGVILNLIHRVCDVALKENVPLVVAVREMPLNQIHLENMLKLQRMGAKAFVLSPAFYGKPKTLEDLLLFTVGKILDLLGVKNSIYKRWREV